MVLALDEAAIETINYYVMDLFHQHYFGAACNAPVDVSSTGNDVALVAMAVRLVAMAGGMLLRSRTATTSSTHRVVSRRCRSTPSSAGVRAPRLTEVGLGVLQR